MIRVSLGFDSDGLLRKLQVEGHANLGGKGNDIVCSAVTSLVRTAARLIERLPGTDVSGGADSPGEFRFSVERVSERREEYLRAIGDFIVLGLKDIESEYPGRCGIEITTIGS